MNKTVRRGALSGVVILVPLMIFALLAMLLITMGISVYSGVINGSEENYSRRTAVSYISNRVRRADRAGSVTLGEYGGSDALLIGNEYNDTAYVTIIYYYNGYIRELFCKADAEIDVNGGASLMPAKEFSISTGDGFVTITVMDEYGSVNSCVIALKGVPQ